MNTVVLNNYTQEQKQKTSTLNVLMHFGRFYSFLIMTQ